MAVAGVYGPISQLQKCPLATMRTAFPSRLSHTIMMMRVMGGMVLRPISMAGVESCCCELVELRSNQVGVVYTSRSDEAYCGWISWDHIEKTIT